MKMSKNSWFSIIATAIIFVALIFLAVWWDMYRWHSFQDVTNSDIGYWKWKFVFDQKSGGGR